MIISESRELTLPAERTKTVIKLFFKYTRGVILERVPLTVGTVGLDCSFDFSDEWDGLTKTAVFDGSGVTKDVILLENTVDVPPEVLAEAGGELRIGVYGMDGDGNIVIPTMYVTAGAILESADPDKDPSTDGSLEVWAQTLNIALDARKKAVAAEAAAIGEKESAAANAKSSEDSAKASERSKVEAENAETNAKNYSAASSKAAAEAIAAKEAALTTAEVAMGAAVTASNESTLAHEYALNAGERAAAAKLAEEEAKKAAELSKQNVFEHSWNGTVLTITSKSGTSSADLKGEGGKSGERGEPGLPKIVYATAYDFHPEASMAYPAYSEVRITDIVNDSFEIGWFYRNIENKGNDMWSITFTVGENFCLYLSSSDDFSIEWAVAEPVFTAGYTYYLSFIPLVDESAENDTLFRGKLLGVWVAKELS